MITFRKWKCWVAKRTYRNGNTALELWDDDGPIATATVNLQDKLAEDLAYIKEYSENAGMLQALMDAGIVTCIEGYKETGYVTVPLCRLDLKAIEREGGPE